MKFSPTVANKVIIEVTITLDMIYLYYMLLVIPVGVLDMAGNGSGRILSVF